MDEKFLKYELELMDDSTWLVVMPHSAMKGTGLIIQEVGDFFTQGSFMTEREGLESYQIVFMYEGEARLTYRNEEHLLVAGCVYFIDCREHYTVRSDGHFHANFVHFNYDKAAHYFEKFISINNNSPVLRLAAPCFVDQGIIQLLELFKNDVIDENSYRGVEIVISLMTHLLITVLPKKADRRIKESVEITLSYLRENFHKKITLDDLAQKTHTSKFHLRQLFCNAMGISPTEYLTRLRISKARELLRLTTNTVSQISEKTGFESTSYFIRLFRKYENMSPGEYRKKWISY